MQPTLSELFNLLWQYYILKKLINYRFILFNDIQVGLVIFGDYMENITT